MKLKTTILTTTLALSCGALIAQDAVQQDPNRDAAQQEQSIETDADAAAQQDNAIISEPSGAEPSGRPFDNDQPPGRAYSTTNPPPGQPFESGERPPGRAFEGEQEIEEPAGAQPADDQQIDTNQQQDVNEPAGAQPESPSDMPLEDDPAAAQPDTGLQTDAENQIEEPAGAKTGGSEQLASALGTLRGGATVGATENVQLRQAIQSSIQGKNVPNEFVDRLSQDLSTAFTKVQIQQTTRTELAEALNTVFTAQPTAQAEIEQALTRVQTILIDNGATRPAARAVACDLHLIATEMHPDLELSVPVPR